MEERKKYIEELKNLGFDEKNANKIIDMLEDKVNIDDRYRLVSKLLKCSYILNYRSKEEILILLEHSLPSNKPIYIDSLINIILKPILKNTTFEEQLSLVDKIKEVEETQLNPDYYYGDILFCINMWLNESFTLYSLEEIIILLDKLIEKKFFFGTVEIALSEYMIKYRTFSEILEWIEINFKDKKRVIRDTNLLRLYRKGNIVSKRSFEEHRFLIYEYVKLRKKGYSCVGKIMQNDIILDEPLYLQLYIMENSDILKEKDIENIKTKKDLKELLLFLKDNAKNSSLSLTYKPNEN